MAYAALGADTSAVEVTNISKHGFWLLLGEQEVFLPFETFPWFREAPVGKVLHVERPSEYHLYWPELDIDLEVESLFHPERYPLQAGCMKHGNSMGQRKAWGARTRTGSTTASLRSCG